MAIYIELGALIVAALFLYLIIQFLKNPLLIIANSVLGLAAFILLNFYFNAGIPVNIWSLATVGFGGIGGFILVVALHYLGLAF